MSNFISLLRKSITSLERFPAILLVAWLVLMLSLPFSYLFLGAQGFSQGLALVVLIQVLLVSRVMLQAWGWWGMLRSAMGVVLLVWAIHAIIVRSGLPYGQLRYSALLQPQLSGIPLVVPLTWLMLLPPCWAVARLITRKASGCLVRPLFILASAISFTSWEVYLDPQMVHAGLWDWGILRGFYGVPWQNFTGYFFISALITFAISPKRLPGGLLVVIYGLSWLVEFFSLLVVGLPAVAMVGFILMGGTLSWAALKSE